MHTLFAFDSFKGVFTSEEAASIASKAFKEQLNTSTETLAIADGGEGTLDTLVNNRRGRTIEVETSDPLGRKIKARYGIIDDYTAVIEMAEAAGMMRLKHDEANPLKASTHGVGTLIVDALERGIRSFIVGIGGSATNDMGMGLLSALGYRFYDARGTLLSASGEAMEKVSEIDGTTRHEALEKTHFVIACDVKNPLFGENGAAYVFAPQKGADTHITKTLDQGLRHFSAVSAKHAGAAENLPRDGAAGGIGAGMRMFLGAELRNGFDVISEICGMDEIIGKADLVVTGEGKIDRQTLSGKAPYELAIKARAMGKPVVAIAGIVDVPFKLRGAFPFDAMLGTMKCHDPDDGAGTDENFEDNLRGVSLEAARLIRCGMDFNTIP